MEDWVTCKDSLTLRRRYNPGIKETDPNENYKTSTTLKSRRNNTLRLDIRNRHANWNTHCNANQIDTLEHLLRHCEAYGHTRHQLPFLDTNTIVEEEKRTKPLLITDSQSVTEKNRCENRERNNHKTHQNIMNQRQNYKEE